MGLVGTFREANGKYRAAIYTEDKIKRLGTFCTEKQASDVYQAALLEKKKNLYDITQDWRLVPDFDLYIINPEGEVRNRKTGNKLAPNKLGMVLLSKEGRKRYGRSTIKLRKIVFENYISIRKKNYKKKKIRF